MMFGLLLATVALVAWGAIAVLMRRPFAQRLADRPNERSLHREPRVRVGGLGIALAVLAFVTPFARGTLAFELLCAAALVVVSALDDMKSLPVHVRLLAHALAATFVVYALRSRFGAEALPAWSVPLAVLSMVWMTNLFNFMDGTDGLAGGMAAIGFCAYALAAALAGDASLAGVSAVIAAASAGFLAHNFPPARVFMGDAGSVPLGFLAAALGLHGVLGGLWPIAFPLLVFSPFIVDATITLARRAWNREPVWRAHRRHVYQRLVLAGWSHRRLALAEYALMIVAGASAVFMAFGEPMLQCGMISVWAVAYALLLFASERHVRRRAADAAVSPKRSAG